MNKNFQFAFVAVLFVAIGIVCIKYSANRESNLRFETNDERRQHELARRIVDKASLYRLKNDKLIPKDGIATQVAFIVKEHKDNPADSNLVDFVLESEIDIDRIVTLLAWDEELKVIKLKPEVAKRVFGGE